MHKHLPNIILILVLIVAAGALVYFFKEGARAGRATAFELCVSECMQPYQFLNAFQKLVQEEECKAKCKQQAMEQQGGGTIVSGLGETAGSRVRRGERPKVCPVPGTPCDDGKDDTCDDKCIATGACIGSLFVSKQCGPEACGYGVLMCSTGSDPCPEGKLDVSKCKKDAPCRTLNDRGETVFGACKDCACVPGLLKSFLEFCNECPADKREKCSKIVELWEKLGKPTPSFSKCDGFGLSFTIEW